MFRQTHFISSRLKNCYKSWTVIIFSLSVLVWAAENCDFTFSAVYNIVTTMKWEQYSILGGELLLGCLTELIVNANSKSCIIYRISNDSVNTFGLLNRCQNAVSHIWTSNLKKDPTTHLILAAGMKMLGDSDYCSHCGIVWSTSSDCAGVQWKLIKFVVKGLQDSVVYSYANTCM